MSASGFFFFTPERMRFGFLFVFNLRKRELLKSCKVGKDPPQYTLLRRISDLHAPEIVIKRKTTFLTEAKL